MERYFILPLLLFISYKISSQQTIKGTLLDSASKKPIEFANLGIPGKGVGTVSDENGNFSVVVPDSLSSEKIKISMIGYRTRYVPAASFTESKTILLSSDAVVLKEVLVSPKSTTVKILGNDTKTRVVRAAFTNNSLGCELAVKLKIKQPQTQLKTFYLNITESKIKDPLFRFNVYSVDENGAPKENILTHNIIIAPKDSVGLIAFDLRPYLIFVDEDVFISVEWIKDMGNNKDIMFSTKLVGIPTYFRQTSQDKWNKIPSGVGLHAEVAY